jgi:hypothetical protein
VNAGVLVLVGGLALIALAAAAAAQAGSSSGASTPATATGGSPAASPAASGTTPSTPSGGYTRQSWASAFLQAAGLPVTSQNIASITAWEVQEGGAGPQFGVANNTANYNPINTTQTAPGANTVNSAGVKSYTSWAQGLDATVQTLKNGLYGGIIHALQTSAPLSSFQSAVNSSPWGTVF